MSLCIVRSLRRYSCSGVYCAGGLPKNHEVLREAYSLCHRLPVMNTPKFREEFYSVRTML